MKKAFLVFLCLVLALGTGPYVLGAEREAAIRFSLKPGETEGLYWLEVTAENTVFNVFQFALNFDPKELVLADASGVQTDDPKEYQENASGGWLSEIGCEANNAKGYLTFAGFVLPGTAEKAPVDAAGKIDAGDAGISLYRFRLKKISEIKKGFSLATEKAGSFYNEALPEGGAVLNGSDALPIALKFTYPEGVAMTGHEEKLVPKEEEPMLTREERLRGTVVLALDNPAAIVEGKRTPIYENEPEITAYTEKDQSYVPVRFVAEALGARVTWNDSSQTVSVEQNGRKASIKIGASFYEVNGKELSAEAAAVLTKDPAALYPRTMVPAQVLADALGMALTVDESGGSLYFAPADAPWDSSGAVERDLSGDISLLLSPLIGAFAG